MHGQDKKSNRVQTSFVSFFDYGRILRTQKASRTLHNELTNLNTMELNYPMYDAIKMRDKDKVVELIPTCKCLENWLWFAAISGHGDICRVLLDAGANPFSKLQYGYSPLHVSGNETIFRIMMEYGLSEQLDLGPCRKVWVERYIAYRELVTFRLASIPRLGYASPAQDFQRDLCKLLFSYLKPL